MKVLLHICCAPCTIYPLSTLREAGYDVTGLFYNPNIHPYREFTKRLDETVAYCRDNDVPLILFDDYPLEEFLRGTAFRESDRCQYCYHIRLGKAANIAKRGKFHAFTTTLLYSTFQNHNAVAAIGHTQGKAYGTPFHYQDFRVGWKEGVAQSKRNGMYRQQYCGCVYSEKERYYKDKRNSSSKHHDDTEPFGTASRELLGDEEDL